MIFPPNMLDNIIEYHHSTWEWWNFCLNISNMLVVDVLLDVLFHLFPPSCSPTWGEPTTAAPLVRGPRWELHGGMGWWMKCQAWLGSMVNLHQKLKNIYKPYAKNIAVIASHFSIRAAICSPSVAQLTTPGALLVYDITRRASFDRLAQWLMDARQNAQPRLG